MSVLLPEDHTVYGINEFQESGDSLLVGLESRVVRETTLPFLVLAVRAVEFVVGNPRSLGLLFQDGLDKRLLGQFLEPLFRFVEVREEFEGLGAEALGFPLASLVHLDGEFLCALDSSIPNDVAGSVIGSPAMAVADWATCVDAPIIAGCLGVVRDDVGAVDPAHNLNPFGGGIAVGARVR